MLPFLRILGTHLDPLPLDENLFFKNWESPRPKPSKELYAVHSQPEVSVSHGTIRPVVLAGSPRLGVKSLGGLKNLLDVTAKRMRDQHPNTDFRFSLYRKTMDGESVYAVVVHGVALEVEKLQDDWWHLFRPKRGS